jgi:hypothetical protein
MQPAPKAVEQTPEPDRLHWDMIRRHGGSGDPPGGGRRRDRERRLPSGRVAYANYEYAFLLCGAINAGRLLRAILSGQRGELLDPDALVQGFEVFEHRGRRFLTGPGTFKFWWWWPMLRPCIVGIYQPSAEAILRAVSNDLDRVPETVEIAVALIGEPADESASIQGDGLALIEDPQKRVDFMNWDFKKGEWM